MVVMANEVTVIVLLLVWVAGVLWLSAIETFTVTEAVVVGDPLIFSAVPPVLSEALRPLPKLTLPE